MCVCVFAVVNSRARAASSGKGKREGGRGWGAGDCTCVVAIKEKGAEEGLTLKKRDRWPGRGEGLGRRTTPPPTLRRGAERRAEVGVPSETWSPGDRPAGPGEGVLL